MTVEPESVGLSKSRLQRITKHLDERYVASGKIAGCLTLVARRGEVAFLEAQGLMDRERNRPMTEDTLFRIYSMSKPVTSVALMMLMEEAHFDLKTPVSKFIPEFKHLGVYAQGLYPAFDTTPPEREMNVQDVLTHMSGLTYEFMYRTNVDAAYRKAGLGDRRGESGKTLKDFVDTLATLPLEFSPGTAWNYSVSTDVCGRLVEIISGQPLDTFFRERIFEPLEMHDSFFEVPDDKIDRFAACYERTRKKVVRLQDDPLESPYRDVKLFSGGGGLVSTAHDYNRFCQMLLRGGELDGARILGRKTIELMTTNHLPGGGDLVEHSVGLFGEVSFEGTGFGLGFSINGGPEAGEISSKGEYAWGGAASTAFWVDPKEELVVVFMTQLMPSRTFDFRGQLKNIIYSSIID
jgi:CubicO group peptidase (beta-lactamase class C family)